MAHQMLNPRAVNVYVRVCVRDTAQQASIYGL